MNHSRSLTAALLLILAGCNGGGSPVGAPRDGGPSPSGEIDPMGAAEATASIALDLSHLPADTFVVPSPEGLGEARARAAALVAQMTLDEKVGLLHGMRGEYVGNVVGVPRLSIPPFSLHDGPAGVAGGMTGVTAFPAPLAVAATWDPDLARRYGVAMAEEGRAKGVSVQLAPMMNLARTQGAGRNFESFGEDPSLSAELAAAVVTGIQSVHVVATAKHFVGNEQEQDRMSSDSVIDERTLHELYYAPFEGAVRAGVGAVMCSYNLINGTYACENSSTLSDLRTSLGFSGWVMSDWGATHSTVQAASSGLDMEMPASDYFGDALLAAVSSQEVAEAQVDEMATRVLSSLARVGVLDDPPPLGAKATIVRSADHSAVAREIAERAITLLRNEGQALPLTGITTLAVIGSAATTPVFVGGGSAQVSVEGATAPLDAVRTRAGSSVSVTYAEGGQQALDAAAWADAALVFVSQFSSEGLDHDITLPDETNALIEGIAAKKPRTIVVLETGGAVLLPWNTQVGAIVEAYFGGEELGPALAAVLFGDVSPEGKLPVAFPKGETDLPLPGNSSVLYDEGLFVGQRLLDHKGLDPQYPFGFGLSYTTFAFDHLALSLGERPTELVVSFDVTNTGGVQGAEIAQIYLRFPDEAGEPRAVLRGSARVALGAGERSTLQVVLGPRDFAVWDPGSHGWLIPSGTYRVGVGASERSILLAGSVKVAGSAP